MKQTLIITILFFQSFAFSQELGELTQKDLDEIKRTTAAEALVLKNKLESESSSFYLNRELEIQFQVDTFIVEQTQRKKMDIDYSTAGMLMATDAALDNYDELLNKYYKILLGKLSKEDQNKLKQTQRNWIAYRDAEIELINLMAKDEYSGGGTIQALISLGRILSLTQERVVDLFDYSRLVVGE